MRYRSVRVSDSSRGALESEDGPGPWPASPTSEKARRCVIWFQEKAKSVPSGGPAHNRPSLRSLTRSGPMGAETPGQKPLPRVTLGIPDFRDRPVRPIDQLGDLRAAPRCLRGQREPADLVARKRRILHRRLIPLEPARPFLPDHAPPGVAQRLPFFFQGYRERETQHDPARGIESERERVAWRLCRARP